jgi:hypothetical protein
MRHAPGAPQHFFYFLPLPHGQGLFRPIFSDLTAWGGVNAFSRSEISSGLSGSKRVETIACPDRLIVSWPLPLRVHPGSGQF